MIAVKKTIIYNKTLNNTSTINAKVVTTSSATVHTNSNNTCSSTSHTNNNSNATSASNCKSMNDNSISNNNTPLYIGVDIAAFGASRFKGWIQSISIWNKSLTSTEVNNLYSIGRSKNILKITLQDL